MTIGDSENLAPETSGSSSWPVAFSLSKHPRRKQRVAWTHRPPGGFQLFADRFNLLTSFGGKTRSVHPDTMLSAFLKTSLVF